MMSRTEEPISSTEPEGRMAEAGEAAFHPSRPSGPAVAESLPGIDPSGRWKDQVGLATLAACLIVATTTWYLLKEFAPLLRPLLLAIFLCYVILPSHRQLTQRFPAMA